MKPKDSAKSGKKRVASVNQGGLQSTPQWSIDHEAIRKLRERRKLTMEQAAAAAGMSHRQAWYRVESGGRKSVSLETLVSMSLVLRCKVDAMLRFVP